MKTELNNLAEAWIAFEFSVPRMGKRADVIVICRGVVFVIEFKIGAAAATAAAIDQAVDYAVDLKNFHAGSYERPVVPVVVATRAPSYPLDLRWMADGVAEPVLSNGSGLGEMLHSIVKQTPVQSALEGKAWARSGYKPTPTIIEAAQALYRGHRVEDITRSDAGVKNLTQTTARLANIIEAAKQHQHKSICFVTGVPGAGKTLAGLNLVTQRTKAHEDEHAVFLSGNGPLVDVLREALARDEQAQSLEAGHAITKADATRKVRSFIQNIHHFRDDNLRSPMAPIERVAIFDEVQRAWDLNQVAKFMAQKKGVPDFSMSEPEFLISVMDRHDNWCTIVCLVGGGQEINAGEAGLTEWFSALKRRFPNWKVFASPALTHRDYHWGQDLAAQLSGLDHQIVAELHLSVSVRSFRAEKLSEFVGALIAGEAKEARELHASIKSSYPIFWTRDLGATRSWLQKQARGTERFGLVASSGASRLKPMGVNVHEKINATHWFLNEKTDVRSSYYLEDPATQFDVQGLELDWVGVCWDADFRYGLNGWSHHKFRGTVWENIASRAHQTYLANAYRVLLTRARQGMILYIPEGDERDPTRHPSFYAPLVAYLEQCGISEWRGI